MCEKFTKFPNFKFYTIAQKYFPHFLGGGARALPFFPVSCTYGSVRISVYVCVIYLYSYMCLSVGVYLGLTTKPLYILL